jgi:hypothetical protein
MTTPAGDENYEVARQGIPEGTFPLSALAGLIDSGRLRWSDDCWTEGMEGWRKIHEIKDLVEASAASESDTDSFLPPVGIALGLAIAVGLGYAVMQGDDSSSAGEASTPAVSSPRTLSARERSTRRSLSELQDQITALTAANFTLSRDPATGALSYFHRFYEGVGNRIPLRVEVAADGRCHLYTYYRGREWLLHRQLRLTIDRQIIETERLPAHRCARQIEPDNFVMESCHFRGEADQKIVTRLATGHGSSVRLEMVGPIRNEITVSFETKQAIRDAQELGELLGRRQRLLSTLTSAP